MARDHYISQVHLKNFNNSDGVLHAMLKRDQKTFTNHAKAFCQIEGGSTNRYLVEDRVIEDFLKVIEPQYNESVEKLRSDKIDGHAIYTIAGFVAYAMWFSPAGLRINKSPLEQTMKEVSRRLDKLGKFGPSPASLGGRSMTELLERGEVELKVDPKYPQAFGVGVLKNQIDTYANFDWEIMKNPFPNCAFFTSDYPIGIVPSESHRMMIDRLVPLAPDLAVRIRAKLVDSERIDRGICSNRTRVVTLNRQGVLEVNRLIVRCAESIVFYPKPHDWIAPFVKANAAFRIEPRTIVARDGTRTMQLSTTIVTDEGPQK